MRKALLALAVMVSLGDAAAAQDMSFGSIIDGGEAVRQLPHRAMESMLGIDTYSGRGGRSSRPLSGGGAFAAPTRPGIQAPAFSYSSTPALRRAAAEAYVARVARNNSAAAAAISAEMKRHDFGQLYAGIVAPFGYRSDDAADALAAYTLLGWLIANGQAEPTQRQAVAVRLQIASLGVGSPVLTNPASRAQLGEELKLLFVTLHAGWQSATREGTLRQYADGVASMFLTSGTDLRRLRLTDTGLIAR